MGAYDKPNVEHNLSTLRCQLSSRSADADWKPKPEAEPKTVSKSQKAN